MKIVDNFLPKDQLETIKDIMIAPQFPWYYNPIVVYNDIQENITLPIRFF